MLPRGLRMTVQLFLFCVISNLVCWSRAEISCYGCDSTHTLVNNSTKLCSNFELSDKYEIRCGNSTFCMKKTLELDLPAGNKVRIVERRCAPQQSRVLEYRQRWVPVNVIDEKLYVEGCSWEQIDFKVTKTEYCYCSSNYCNSGQRVAKTSVFHHTDVMFIIFIVNSIKFILSIR